MCSTYVTKTLLAERVRVDQILMIRVITPLIQPSLTFHSQRARFGGEELSTKYISTVKEITVTHTHYHVHCVEIIFASICV